jgi:branched-chain amino acid transport system ATP-binding protein
VLSIENLHVRYGAITALRDVSIDIQQGELVALIGVNGAGKSTVLLSVAGILKPYRGDIRLMQTSILNQSPEAILKKGIAMVPESRDIFPGLTVYENLRLGAYTRKDRAEFNRDLDETFELFPILKERLTQPGGTLSGGEQQQLAIARALMSHPSLLMLDEPSLGLAPALVDQIFYLINRLHQSGVTILLVEQNVDRTLKIANRAYVLKTGQVAMHGLASEIRQQVDIEKVYLGS